MSEGKNVIPRFEHDEHQAFYDAQIFLREEEDNYEEIDEIENEYKNEWEQHNSFQEELEPEQRLITEWKGSENEYSKEQIQTFIDWIDNEKSKGEILQNDCSVWKPEMLNKKQRFVYDIVKQHFCTKSKKPLRLGFYGRPGTGKSVTIHCLKKLLGDKCRIAACTGSAGNNVNGQTLHSLLRISIAKQQRKFNKKELIQLQEKWKNIDYLIIDEISLVSQTLLSRINENLKLFKTNHNNEPFGGILLLNFRVFFVCFFFFMC